MDDSMDEKMLPKEKGAEKVVGPNKLGRN